MKERSMQGKFQSRHFIRWGLAIFGAAILFLLPAGRAAAQSDTAGPLPAATPAQTASAAQPTGQSTTESTGARPNFAGRWALNKDQSDDPRQKMRQAMGGGGGGQGGGYGGHGGWGGGGYGGGGYGGNGGGGRHGRGQGEGMLNELSQLTIEQTNSSAKVTGSSGRVLALYSANSAAAPVSTPGGSSTSSNSSSSSGSGSSGGGDDYAPPAAQWQGSQLVAIAERRRGTNAQTYELSPDGKQLFVTTKMESQRFTEPVVFRLVYDPVKINGGSSQ